MSNSREIMERRILLSNGNYQIFKALRGLSVDFIILDDDFTIGDPILPPGIECQELVSALPAPGSTYKPNHSKQRRGKFKRPGR